MAIFRPLHYARLLCSPPVKIRSEEYRRKVINNVVTFNIYSINERFGHINNTKSIAVKENNRVKAGRVQIKIYLAK
jgi:hypothetical protein